MQLPPQPGVYVVELLNEHPISVNADRQKIAEQCIKVTRDNCKYGQAKNLARRRLDYIKTFGEENVRFRFYAVTPHYSLVEAAVGMRLMPYRIAGTTGRLNEWLQGISSKEVEHIVREVLESLGTPAPLIPQEPVTPARTRVSPAPISSTSPALLVEMVQYLEQKGMSVEQLRDLHHSQSRRETFKASQNYFSGKTTIRGNNILYCARLSYVAEQHRSTGRQFSELVQDALARHPK